MKHKISPIMSLFVVVLLIAACAPQAPATEAPATPRAVEDQDSLLEALKNKAIETEGAKVELGDSVEQAFLNAQGQIIKVNDADVQVFEYESADALEADAAQISPDGGSTATTMITWMATPHFFKSGRVLVLYVGDDPAVLALLKSVLSEQFAGR